MKLRYELSEDKPKHWCEFAFKPIPASTGTHEDLMQVLRQVCEAKVREKDFEWLWMKLFNRKRRLA